MLQKPPALRVLKSRRRPTAAQIAAFQDTPASFVSDAMGGGGVLDTAIAPLPLGPGAPVRVAGPALTVDNIPGDLLGTLAGLHLLTPGDVYVVTVGGHQACSASGDLVAGMAKNAGAAGFVLDGPLRDLDGLERVGLPAWCTGLNPSSPTVRGPGAIGFPIVIGGCPVDSGDMVVADRDGVVVVPFHRIDAVIAVLEQVRADEAAMEAEVAAGRSGFDDIAAMLDSDATVYED